jgi:Plasmid pRiA4b ORF-3-like protein
MPDSPESNIYQLRAVLLGISPIIWRRLLVRSDSTIVDLHDTLQITFGWSGDHLHRFLIYGKQYGVSYLGGITFRDDPRRIKLSDLGLRVKEKFLYEYDFIDQWRHLIRIEAILPLEPDQFYPVCISGKRSAPPEDCGGPWAFMERRDEVPCEVWERFWQLKEDVEAGDLDAVREQMESIDSMREWLTLDRFDRRAVNRRLKQDVEKDQCWQLVQKG